MLEGRSFKLFNYQKPLTRAFFKVKDSVSNRQRNQLSFISEFCTDVAHVPGFQNLVVNTLSRQHDNEAIVNTIVQNWPTWTSSNGQFVLFCFWIAGIYPQASSKKGAHGPQSDNSRYLCAVVFTSPLTSRLCSQLQELQELPASPPGCGLAQKGHQLPLTWAPGPGVEPGSRGTKLWSKLDQV